MLTENIKNTNYRVNDLYYIDNLGRIFNYYFEEQNVPEGYTAVSSEVVQSFVDGVHVFTMSIENRYAPPLMNIEVTKIWRDEGGPLRPDEITLKLFRGQRQSLS